MQFLFFSIMQFLYFTNAVCIFHYAVFHLLFLQWTAEHQRAPAGYAPGLQWQLHQVANFAEQRQVR